MTSESFNSTAFTVLMALQLPGTVLPALLSAVTALLSTLKFKHSSFEEVLPHKSKSHVSD